MLSNTIYCLYFRKFPLGAVGVGEFTIGSVQQKERSANQAGRKKGKKGLLSRKAPQAKAKRSGAVPMEVGTLRLAEHPQHVVVYQQHLGTCRGIDLSVSVPVS